MELVASDGRILEEHASMILAGVPEISNSVLAFGFEPVSLIIRVCVDLALMRECALILDNVSLRLCFFDSVATVLEGVF
jgi:hypothetical protein